MTMEQVEHGSPASGVPNSTLALYAELKPDVASMVREAGKRIRGHKRGDVLAIGRELLAVKAALPHGLFLRWLALEFEGTARTARNYASAAEVFGDKPEIISLLPSAILYRVAQAPKATRQEIIDFVGRGGRIDLKTVAWMLRQIDREKEWERYVWAQAERDEYAADFAKILLNNLSDWQADRIINILEAVDVSDVLVKVGRKRRKRPSY